MPGRERDTGAAVALDAAALWRAATVPPLLSSFSEEALAAARDAAPDLKRALLVERIPADWAVRLSRLACTALDVDHRELNADIIAAAHQSGYKVMTYTANNPHAVTQLAAWGVDVIITDAIDVINPA
jgi:glycerophosphoryl diester phosphodiesterase